MLSRNLLVVRIFNYLVVAGLTLVTLSNCGKETVNVRRDEQRRNEERDKDLDERLDRLEQDGNPISPAPAGPQGDPGGPGPTGSAGPSGVSGDRGANGNNGSNGASASLGTVSVLGIDRSLSWTTSNHTQITQLTRVEVYLSFSVAAMPSPSSNPQNHWVDIVVGEGASGAVFCYQRRTGSVWYDLVYRKVAGALTGCDSNSDKNLGAWPNSNTVNAGGVVRVIPRDPKLNGVLWDLTLNTWTVQ